jgi:Uma2 family endonuclease
MTVSKRDTKYHTYGDYLVWSRTYGDELVDGTAYVREPPSPTRAHQEIVGEIHRQAATALKGKPGRAFVAPFDVRLPKETEADEQVDTVVQPDIFIVCDLQKVDERGVRGAPDWLVEVLSRSTRRHDKVVKLPVYERAGVREVWLIDPTARTVTIYRLRDGSYGPPTTLPLKGKTQLAAVPDVTIDWDEVVAEML